MTTVFLKSHKEESLKRFHPWVFSGAIARVVLDAEHKASAPEEGELVCVRSAAHEVLGVGHWQVGSIAVRILAFGVENLPADFWSERIRTAYKVRETLGLIQPDNNTFRLVHGEGDFLPGLIVDVYAETAVIQAHSVGMHMHRNEIAKAIVAEVPQVKNVYYKSDDTLPFKAPIEAAHECGHAVQHAHAYGPLKMRSALVPVVSFSSNWVMWILLAGMLLIGSQAGHVILLVGIGLYAMLTLFSFITLPVEVNASRRAVNWLEESGITDRQTTAMASDALKSAAYTYVVAAMGSLATLLYYIMIYLGSSRR